MGVCKYFMQGNCRYGNNCWNDHPGGGNQGYSVTAQRQLFGGGRGGQGGRGNKVSFQDSYSSSQNYNSNQNQYKWVSQDHQQSRNQPTQPMSSSDIVKGLGTEIQTTWEGGKMWPFTCLGFEKELPSIPGFSDISMEEMRHEAYLAEKEGNSQPYIQKYEVLYNEVNNTRQELKNPNITLRQKLIAFIDDCRRQKNQGTAQVSLFSNETSGSSGFGQSGGLFGKSQTQSTGLFGKTETQSAFGQSGTQSVFGQSSQTGFGQSSQTGFGQTAQTNFGQSSQSTFGQTAFGSQSGQTGFGQTTTTGFGQSSSQGLFGKSSGFGQTTQSGFGQASPGGFGQSAFGSQASSGSGAQATGFGLSSTAAPSGSTGSGFGQPGFGQAQTIAASGFGGQSTSNSSANTQTNSVYSNPTDLSNEELEQFKAAKFTLGLIPTKPPPKELCV